MITGFNSDVDYEGRTYHVQTEDRGVTNPIIESLVYSGGEIVTTRKTSYEDMAESGDFVESELMQRMKLQHQDLIEEIRSGRYDPEGPKPFGYNIVSNRSLDEVVMTYLAGESGVVRVRLEVEDSRPLVEGTPALILMRVMSEGADEPVQGAEVTVKLISSRERPTEVFKGVSDAEGRVGAEFDLPLCPGGEVAILCQAQSSGNNAEFKQLVKKPQDL
jgi:hypothetical protein